MCNDQYNVNHTVVRFQICSTAHALDSGGPTPYPGYFNLCPVYRSTFITLKNVSAEESLLQFTQGHIMTNANNNKPKTETIQLDVYFPPIGYIV